MPRTAREKSPTGVYHVVVRGINRQNIFEDDEDKQKYLERLSIIKKKYGFELYAYCLMNNHAHLLINEAKSELSNIMKAIQTSYVYYFNWKYERSGHLFQDRYKSECVDNEEYFYTVIRYIHQNPAKAGVSDVDKYKWSSYNDYIILKGITDTDYFLGIMGSTDKGKYIEYMCEDNEDICLEINENYKLTDEKAIEQIKNIGKLKNVADIQRLDTLKRNELIKRIKEIEGISILQISRVTGISRGIVKNI